MKKGRVQTAVELVEEIRTLYRGRDKRDFIGGITCDVKLNTVLNSMTEQESEEFSNTKQGQEINNLIQTFQLAELVNF